MFNKIPSQDVITWTTMISGHVQCEQGQKVPDFNKCNRKVCSQTLLLLWGW